MNKKELHVVGAVVLGMALLLSASVTQASTHIQYLPHAGYAEGKSSIIGQCPDGRIQMYEVATGRTVHLGQMEWEGISCVNPFTNEGSGSADITAANGDHVFTEYTSLTVYDTPTSGRWYYDEAVVGGTGRFEGGPGGRLVEEGVVEVQFEPGNPYPVWVWYSTNMEAWVPVGWQGNK